MTIATRSKPLPPPPQYILVLPVMDGPLPHLLTQYPIPGNNRTCMAASTGAPSHIQDDTSLDEMEGSSSARRGPSSGRGSST